MTRTWLWAVLGLAACGDEGKGDADCDPSAQVEVFADADADGAGDPATAAMVCALGAGQVENDNDCDDSDPGISPDAAEACDGLDQNCDGVVDDGLPGSTWYPDTDGDGHGDPTAGFEACAQPPGALLDHSDCDDAHADAYPGAPEQCDGYDNDCDELVDDADPTVDATTGTLFYADSDGDGYGNRFQSEQACANPDPANLIEADGDCDDTRAARNPDATEVCDGLDNDCDGLLDDLDPGLDLGTTETFFEDLDLDGLGNDLVEVQACFLGAGESSVGGDCDDNDPILREPLLWVDDADNDGVGNGVVLGAASCLPPGPDAVPQGLVDCNDANNAVYPGADEVCDTIDNDCDATIDDADPSVDLTTGTAFYPDNDDDGFGSSLVEMHCANPRPSLLVEITGDCDDARADRNPAETEVCDGVDNDCDLLLDEADPNLDESTYFVFYEDLDQDGVGNDAFEVESCAEDPGLASVGGDCNDNDPNIQDPIDWVTDADGDGVGDGDPAGAPACDAPTPDAIPAGGAVDCDDFAIDVYPGALEVCGDLVDSDCDGMDCQQDFTEDFEDGPPLPADFTSSGNQLWGVTTNQAHVSTYSATNGNIGDNQQSHMEIVIDFPAGGTISYWHRTDTEASWDFERFYVDGVLKREWSGFNNWAQVIFNVAPGVHTMKWTYYKDSSVSTIADAIWIDDIEAIGGVP